MYLKGRPIQKKVSDELVDGSGFFFTNFRKDTYRRFPILYPEQEGEEQVDANPPKPEEVIQSVVDYYYQTLMLASQENILNIDPVLKLDLMEVLGYLSFRIDKANKEAERARNAVKK